MNFEKLVLNHHYSRLELEYHVDSHLGSTCHLDFIETSSPLLRPKNITTYLKTRRLATIMTVHGTDIGLLPWTHSNFKVVGLSCH